MRSQTRCRTGTRDTGDRGTAIAEYGALVMVAAVLLGGLYMTLGDRVTPAVKCALQHLFGTAAAGCDGTSSAGPKPPGRPGAVRSSDPGGPTNGPAMHSGLKFDPIPFTGSLTVTSGGGQGCDRQGRDTTCTTKIDGRHTGGDGKDEGGKGVTAGVGYRASGSVSDSRGAPTPGKATCVVTGALQDHNETCDKARDRGDQNQPFALSQLDLGVSVDVSGTATGTLGFTGITLDGKLVSGQKMQYDVNVTPDETDKIRGGRLVMPNPLDPRTVPLHDSVLMTRDQYHGNGLDVSYKGLSAGFGSQDDDKLASGVVRRDANHVTIYVGDEQSVTQAVRFGYQNDTLGIGVSLSMAGMFANTDMRQIDLDLSDNSGWDAYQKFIDSGTLPSAVTGGVTGVTRVKGVKYSQQAAINAKLGQLNIVLSAAPNQLTDTTATTADGTVTNTLSYQDGGITDLITETNKPGGSPETDTYDLVLSGADGQYLNEYDKGAGGRTDYGRSDHVDVLLDFSRADLLRLQTDAMRYIVDWCRTQPDSCPDPPRSAAEVQSMIQTGNADQLPWSVAGGEAQLVEQIAEASSPNAVIAVLQDWAGKSPDQLLDNLAGLVANMDDRSRAAGGGGVTMPGTMYPA